MTTNKNKLARTNSTSNKKSLTTDERGLTTVEYIIVLVLIAVTGFAIWRTFGASVKAKVSGSNDVVNELNATAQ